VTTTSESLLESYVEHGSEVATYSREFLAAVATCGAWSAMVREVLALAAKLRLALNEERLKLSDVHDLQALRFALAERLGQPRAA
jgi:hypothetical protein